MNVFNDMACVNSECYDYYKKNAPRKVECPCNYKDYFENVKNKIKYYMPNIR